ncbi:MAG: hypothetical protein DSM107014_08640 [Gomphosphaeria aponina SAG 52.96 = DSM 107014]|uniref:Uncharacterized protein n=1 Tax=Gomphosphaeria aponina SAG 52.96 = DSM 107014 TaxID=1521640 RepID=A0A941JPR5_9CHRO|nr:hypothetical protein [Gomphosphaeria aponina SAG 52.96 = DSM 107014]
MLKVGMLVRVIYPEYAAGMKGFLLAREVLAQRWIVQLVENLIDNSDQPFLLSLEESDFEVIDLDEEEGV